MAFHISSFSHLTLFMVCHYFTFLLYLIADTPPTYQSLFGDLQRAKKESNGVVDFLKNLTILLVSTGRLL